jgi:exosortase/archaeosortase
MGKFIAIVLLALIGYAILQVIPDLQRYLKISTM